MRADAFRRLHAGRGVLVLPNAWDGQHPATGQPGLSSPAPPPASDSRGHSASLEALGAMAFRASRSMTQLAVEGDTRVLHLTTGFPPVIYAGWA